MNTTIRRIHAREIVDCRGYPTVEVDVELEGDITGRAGVPAGLSTGMHEACEIRDAEARYRGLGVRTAVENVNQVIAPALMGRDGTRQRALDTTMVEELDGTPDKSKLGANAIVGVSMALARAAAAAAGKPLFKHLNNNARVIPVPLFNLINGGKHASGDLDIQEFIIMPVGAETFSHALQICTEVTFELRDLIVAKYGKIAVNIGDEGGFVPPMHGAREPLDFLVEAVDRAGYSDLIVYGLDVAASHFYDPEEQVYHFAGDHLTREDMIALYEELCSEYELASIEDALYEDDFEGWAQLTAALPDVQWVGDDLFVTNPDRLRKGIDMGAANALLWKINQIGTLTEALDVAEMAYRHGYGVQVSERSGETEDPIIADFTVALNAGQIKTGAPVRGERTSKYNQLLRIEEMLGGQAVYAGHCFRWQG
ncbi:MAG: phosphopyruvate hydratase [Anaerolineae bacterium]|jgi:enolase